MKIMSTLEELDPARIARSIEASFKPDVIREVLSSSFSDSKSKLGPDALALVCELAKLLALEGALRASAQALRDASRATDLEHVEKCLPQLMLDFP